MMGKKGNSGPPENHRHGSRTDRDMSFYNGCAIILARASALLFTKEKSLHGNF